MASLDVSICDGISVCVVQFFLVYHIHMTGLNFSMVRGKMGYIIQVIINVKDVS